MRNRLFVAGMGIVIVSIALAGLLGVINLLSHTKPTPLTSGPSTNANQTANQKTSGASLSRDISPEGSLPPHIPLFNINGAANTAFLRNTATLNFDGDIWKFDPNSQSIPYNGGKIVPPVTGYAKQLTDEIKVTPLEKFPSGPVTLPTSLYPTSLSSSQPLQYLPDEQLFISEQGMPESYSFQAVHYTFDEAKLTEAEVDSEAKYLQLPPETTERTRHLANEITKDLLSPYQKAKAIEKYLKANETYDLNYQQAPPGQEPNDWFLFDEKKGVCDNFNSAFVMLSRSVGIPSRLVGGYAISPKPGEQTVYTDQAHAWSEVKLKDLGWITFDATGSGSGPLATITEITSVSPIVQKGHSFSVQGTVKTQNGDPADGVPMEIFVNSRKDTVGGMLVGEGTVTQGIFNIEAVIPGDTKVGDYQLLAHCLGGIRYQHSWSDPKIKVATETKIGLDFPQRVKVSEPVVVQGTLAEEFKQPVAGQTIDLFLNNQLVSRLNTDKGGQFNWEQSFSRAGDYTIKASFPGTDYYLQTSQGVNFQVLIPTILNVQAPQKANAKELLLLEGSLSEEKTGIPVANRQIEILIDGKLLPDKITTSKDGTFKVAHIFDKEGIYQIEARFNSVPYYWESRAGAVTEISPASGSFPWLYLIIAMVLLFLGVGGFFFYRWQRRRPLIAPMTTPVIPELTYTPVVEERKKGNGITLSLEFPQIEPPFPDVWGLDEQLEVICYLFNADGTALAAKPLELIIGNNATKITTDAKGTGLFQCTFTKKGHFKLVAQYIGEPGDGMVTAESLVRIVDYREENVELFNFLVVWLRNLGIDLAPKATPREIAHLVLQSGKGLSEVSLDIVVSRFEEADYSLHNITRRNYQAMYLAQKEIREYEPKPQA